MVPGSITQIPFMQEVFVFTWRLMTTNQVSRRLTSVARLRRLHAKRRLPLKSRRRYFAGTGSIQKEPLKVQPHVLVHFYAAVDLWQQRAGNVLKPAIHIETQI